MCVSHSDPPGGPTSTVSTAAPQDFIRHATIEGVVVVGMRQDVSMFEMFQKEAEGVRKLMGAEVCGGIWVLLAFEERRNVRGRTGAWDVGVGEDWKSGTLAWRRTRTLAWRADTNLLDSGGPEIETFTTSEILYRKPKHTIANQRTRSQINAHDRKSTHTIAMGPQADILAREEMERVRKEQAARAEMERVRIEQAARPSRTGGLVEASQVGAAANVRERLVTKWRAVLRRLGRRGRED
ncbi:hypothetical protein F4604DRAFT_1680339 [Suillus subluteus]|nr:hypothetical protein F4604DRAFT_1680339 [Suillus subluteus]